MFPEHGTASQRAATFLERVAFFERMVFMRCFLGEGVFGLGTLFRQNGSRSAGVVALLALLHSLGAAGSSRFGLLWRWADGIDRMVFPRSQTSAAVRARGGRTGRREGVFPVYAGNIALGLSKGVA